MSGKARGRAVAVCFALRSRQAPESRPRAPPHRQHAARRPATRAFTHSCAVMANVPRTVRSLARAPAIARAIAGTPAKVPSPPSDRMFSWAVRVGHTCAAVGQQDQCSETRGRARRGGHATEASHGASFAQEREPIGLAHMRCALRSAWRRARRTHRVRPAHGIHRTRQRPRGCKHERDSICGRRCI
jgi:hypothetical protein